MMSSLLKCIRPLSGLKSFMEKESKESVKEGRREEGGEERGGRRITAQFNTHGKEPWDDLAVRVTEMTRTQTITLRN